MGRRLRPRPRHSTPPSCSLSSPTPSPKAWERLVAVHGGEAGARTQFADRLAKQIDERGTVDVLRHGVNDHGIEVRLAYFKPAHGLTPELTHLYEANRLTVTRQLPYEATGTKTPRPRAVPQRHPGRDRRAQEPAHPPDRRAREAPVPDRPRPREPDAAPGAGPLRGRPRHRRDDHAARRRRRPGSCRSTGATTGGKGNPPDPTGHRTRYLWEELWARDAWLDILARFIHVDPGRRCDEGGEAAQRHGDLPPLPPVGCRPPARGGRPRGGPRAQLPRPALRGLGQEQHDRLARPPADEPPRRRRRARVRQGGRDHRPGDPRPPAPGDDLPVRARDGRGRADRPGLRRSSPTALTGEQARIVITTLQKFPFILDKVTELGKRRFAVIVDEAHSSPDRRGREGAARRPWAPRRPRPRSRPPSRPTPPTPPADPQDALAANVAARGRQPNMSFFAFTATPKARTLELFGRRDADGNYAPVPPVLDAPGDRGGVHPRRARQLHDLRRVLEGGQGGRGRPRVRHPQGEAGDRALGVAPPAQPRPEGRADRRALPRPTPATRSAARARRWS